MPDDPLRQAAENLEEAAKRFTDVPALLQSVLAQNAAMAAAQHAAQQAAWQLLPLTQPGYVYQPQTPQQAAQHQAQQQQQYPPGGTPAWQAAPPPAPSQPAQQQAQQAARQQAQAAGPTPGDLALAAARATPMPPQTGAGGELGFLGDAVSVAGRGLSALSAAAGAATAALGTLGVMGRAASPTHAATLSGSVELLAARLGSAVLPAMEEASRLLQNAARNLPDINQRQPGLAGYSIQDLLSLSARVGAAVVTQGGSEMPGNRAPAALSYRALPQPTIGSAESYHDRLTTQALGQGPLDTEILQEILKNLQRQLGILERGAGGETNTPAAFR